MTTKELEKLNEKLSKELSTLESINEYLKNHLKKINAKPQLSPGITIIETDFSSYVPAITYREI